jgi:hypothetical protein
MDLLQESESIFLFEEYYIEFEGELYNIPRVADFVSF